MAIGTAKMSFDRNYELTVGRLDRLSPHLLHEAKGLLGVDCW